METPHVFINSSMNFAQNNDPLISLIDRAKSGDQAAFSDLYNQFFKKIYRFIFFRVSHKEVAEDLAEDVFVRAYKKMSSVKQADSFEGWLYQIARNRIIDHYREKKITVSLDEMENTLEYNSNIVDLVNLQHDQAILLKLLKELTGEQQSVIKMKFLEELDNNEIALSLGKTEGAIRVIQHRAIIKLQSLMKIFLKK